MYKFVIFLVSYVSVLLLDIVISIKSFFSQLWTSDFAVLFYHMAVLVRNQVKLLEKFFQKWIIL